VHATGIHPVVVHGGGPQINALMRRLGKCPRFVDGLRVPDEDTMEPAECMRPFALEWPAANRLVECASAPA
jgi:acetylglutamate kinase